MRENERWGGAPGWARGVATMVICLAASAGPLSARAQGIAHAAAPLSTAMPLHPWVTTPPRAVAPEVYFTNLKSGDSIETPFVLHFGLTGYGIAPIVKGVPRTGHHHLLVNRELPLNFKEPLPFNEQYIHFGKGQMETVLNFPPGIYTLRLLLADHKHIPHFIYSKPTTITVTRKTDADPKSLVAQGVAILAPTDGAPVQAPFKVQFHASGLNVSHVDLQEKGSGHFRLVAMKPDGKSERIDFPGGQTETWLQPPVGSYALKLEFVSNSEADKVLATSAPVNVKVAAR